MASIDDVKANGKITGFKVRWRNPDGGARSRTYRVVEGAVDVARKAARDFCADVQKAEDENREWKEPEVLVVPTVNEVSKAYLRHLARGCAPSTVVDAGKILKQFEAHVGEDSLITLACRTSALTEWVDALDVAESTKTTRAQCVRSFWLWVSEHEDYQPHGIRPPPRLKTLNIRRPVTRRPKAPTWAECDACIGALDEGTSTWRAAVIMRFTGLRIFQTIALDWNDFDLDARTMTVRNGKSRQEKAGRVVPISAHLAEIMGGWGRREGPVCPGRDPKRPMNLTHACDKLLEGWQASGVRVEAWGKTGDRGNARPGHAFRYAFESELKRAGADDEAVEYLVGHAAGLRGHYVDEDALPLREAVDMIPAIGRGMVKRMQRTG